MGSGTGLGRVRGLGSAKSGSHHWWVQRVTAVGNILLVLWLIASLLFLRDYSFENVRNWLASPFAAVPMILLIINVFWHFRLGLQVVIEDYVHGGARIFVMGLVHIWTFGLGALALFAIFKIAFTGAI